MSVGSAMATSSVLPDMVTGMALYLLAMTSGISCTASGWGLCRSILPGVFAKAFCAPLS